MGLDNAWCESTSGACKYFDVDSKLGLSKFQVEANRKKWGRNEMPPEEGKSLWAMIVEQFEDLLVRILLLAACISFVLALFEEEEDGEEHSVLGAFIEPLVILTILIANACVGIWQEQNAESAIEALKEYEPAMAKVFRQDRPGQVQQILAGDLVPGDIVDVSVGDQIPADLRILEIKSTTLRIDQALLTGESVSVPKGTEAVPDTRAVNQDKINLLFSGTNVASGKAVGVVIKTGQHTEIGKIRESMVETETEKTPLAKKLDEFGEQLSKMISIICVLVWAINIGHFNDPMHGGSWVKGAIYYFKIAVALAVAAIPEGLPIVVTVTLALGVLRMASHNAVVRRLPAVETLGSVDVLCSDKTGTLTKGEMAVTEALLSDGSRASIGQLVMLHGEVQHGRSHPLMEALTTACVVCNNVQPTYGKKRGLGNPTEAALMGFAQKLGLEDLRNDWLRVKEIPFTSDSKTMAVQAVYNRDPDRKPLWFVKGAPEIILEKCFLFQTRDGRQNLTTKTRISLNDHATYMMNQGLRVLAIAKGEKTPDELIFLGLVGISDPPRPSASKAVAELRERGVELKMITGGNFKSY